MGLKTFIRNIPIIGPFTKSTYDRVSGNYKREPSYWVAKRLGETAYIVQIGSNDGKTGDPIFDLLAKRKQWSALFVEPVPYLFERLRQNYQSESRFRFENSIINDGSSMNFYWVSEDAKKKIDDLPYYYDQLGGFDRSHITKHLPELEPFILESTLEGITLDGLFQKHSITKVDCLHIDTEGADFAILSQLDLDKYRPALILYERKHLSNDKRTASIQFLQDYYTIYNFEDDFFAVEKALNFKNENSLWKIQQYIVSA